MSWWNKKFGTGESGIKLGAPVPGMLGAIVTSSHSGHFTFSSTAPYLSESLAYTGYTGNPPSFPVQHAVPPVVPPEPASTRPSKIPTWMAASGKLGRRVDV